MRDRVIRLTACRPLLHGVIEKSFLTSVEELHALCHLRTIELASPRTCIHCSRELSDEKKRRFQARQDENMDEKYYKRV